MAAVTLPTGAFTRSALLPQPLASPSGRQHAPLPLKRRGAYSLPGRGRPGRFRTAARSGRGGEDESSGGAATTVVSYPDVIPGTIVEEEEEEQLWEDDEGVPSSESEDPMLSPSQAFWVLNFAALLYGTNSSSVKALVESDVQPSEVSLIRFVVAALALAPLLGQGTKTERFWPISMELGLYLGVGFGAQALELQTTTASEGSVLLAVTMVLVPIMESMSGIPYTRAKAVCLAVSLAGISILVGSKEAGDAAAAGASMSEGVAYGLVSSVFFAAHLVRSEALQKEAGSRVSLALGASQMVTTSFWMALWEAYEVVQNHQTLGLDDLGGFPWGRLVICSVFCTALCQTLELMSVSAVPASTASLTLSLLIPYGIGCGVLLRGDVLNAQGILGSLLIVGAGVGPNIVSALRNKSTKEEETVEEPEARPVEERLAGATATTAAFGASLSIPVLLLRGPVAMGALFRGLSLAAPSASGAQSVATTAAAAAAAEGATFAALAETAAIAASSTAASTSATAVAEAVSVAADKAADLAGDVAADVAYMAADVADLAADVAADVADKAADLAGDVAADVAYMAADVADLAADVASTASEAVADVATSAEAGGAIAEALTSAMGVAVVEALTRDGAAAGALTSAAAGAETLPSAAAGGAIADALVSAAAAAAVGDLLMSSAPGTDFGGL